MKARLLPEAAMFEPHKTLLDEYVAELRAAKVPVNAWWQRVIAAEIEKTGSPAAALQRLKQVWPKGPATHPIILGIVRKYFLACQRLNQVGEDMLRSGDDS